MCIRDRAVDVRLGLTDGSMTEIVSGDIKDGQEVIAGQQTAAKPPGMPGPRDVYKRQG